MRKVEFKGFVGLDKKSSDVDLKPTMLREAVNISLSNKLGSIVKNGTYSDISNTLVNTLPSGVTIKSIIQLNLTRPSIKDIYLMHGVNGASKNVVYVGPYWNGLSFETSWVELTEVTAQITLTAADITAGTTSSQIVIDSTNSAYSGLSIVNDYYNEWFMTSSGVGTFQNLGCRVVDYIYNSGAATKTFTVVASSLLNIASGDIFSFARTKLGLNKDSVVDGTIKVDDMVRWLKRENGSVGMTGNGNQFPTQFQLWVGYINRTYGNSSGGTTVEINEFTADIQQLLAPYTTDSPPAGGSSVIELGAGGSSSSLTTGTWTVYGAYIYDGFKLGPLSEGVTQVITAGQELLVFVDLAVRASQNNPSSVSIDSMGGTIPPKYDDTLLSPRITGLYLYAKIPGESVEKRMSDIEANAWIGAYAGAPDQKNAPPIKIASLDSSDNNAQLSTGGYISGSITFISDPVGNSYLQDAGQTNLQSNFTYGESIGSHLLGAKIINEDDERQDDDVIGSIVDGAGVFNTDAFGAGNLINLGFHGGGAITGIHIVTDKGLDESPKLRAIIFTDDEYFTLKIISGNIFSFQIDSAGTKEGLLAPGSLLYAEGNLFGVSRNGFRLYTASGTKIIGEGLKPDFDVLTNPSECKSGYLKKERLAFFHFASDSKTYAIDLLSENFSMFEYTFADTFTGFMQLRDGGLLAIDGTKIYKIGNGNDQNGTKVVPKIKTIIIDASHPSIGGATGDILTLKSGLVRYESDSPITVNYYLDRGSVFILPTSVLFGIKSSMDTVKHGFPIGTTCKEIQVEITLDATQKLTNTVFEIESFGIELMPNKAILFD